MEEVIYRDLKTIDYARCWEMQKEFFGRLVAAKDTIAKMSENVAGTDAGKETGSALTEKASQYLLLCEHPPVYTLGKSGDENNILFDERFLRDQGASFFHIDRGGDITFHGPGQLVGYPVLDLEREGIGLRQYINLLEEAVIETIAEFGISGVRVEGAAGIWLKDDKPLRKICAIGVRSSRFVTMHGFALNVNTDLRWFDYINPCGFADRGVTSMAKEVGKSVDMDDVKRLFAAHFGKIINVKIKIEDYAN